MNRSQALMQLIEETNRGEFHFSTSARLAIKIKETLDDPDCHLEAAEKLIQAEPLLAARVVAIANSVVYNRSGPEITDVRTAAGRIGFQTLRMLAMAFVTRQMAGTPSSPEQMRMSVDLWEHTAHVAALCHVIASNVTKKSPDTALFAGLIHEIGGFYLLSRAEQFPVLLEPPADDSEEIDQSSVVNALSLSVLINLRVPEPVLNAVEQYAEGFLSAQPTTLGDTLMLADHMAPVKSPWASASGADNARLDSVIEAGLLKDILQESADEVASLTAALRS